MTAKNTLLSGLAEARSSPMALRHICAEPNASTAGMVSPNTLESFAMMGLVVFDVDGTLTDSYAVDEEVYLETLCDFGLHDAERDWSKYKHATDPGIFAQAFETRFGREPTDAEVSNFEQRLVERLDARLRREPERSAPVAGTVAMLHALVRNGRWGVALATGAFRGSLACKLRAAGLRLDRLPQATSSDERTREQIVQLAIRRAAKAQGGFDRTVSVGDGVWDVRTAQALGLPFVGVAHGTRAEQLRLHGARTIFPDYSDLDAFMLALDHAEPPVS